MQLDGWQVAFEQPHVLNEQRVDPGVVELVNHLHGRLDFVVEEQCVDRHKHLAAIEMGVTYQGFDILNAVAGTDPGTESRGTDIDGIGAMVDGLATEFKILGGGEEF